MNQNQTNALEQYTTLTLHGQDVEFVNGVASVGACTVIEITEVSEGSFSCEAKFSYGTLNRSVLVTDHESAQASLDAVVAACAGDPGAELMDVYSTLTSALTYMATGE